MDPKAPTLAEIRQTFRKLDAWWTVFVIDPIAIRVLWLLARAPLQVSPNAITILSLVAGVASAYYFWQRGYVAGALLYQLSFLFDCIDGKLARLQNRSSRFGGFYDGFVNHLVYIINVIALGFSQPSDLILMFGCVSLLALRALNSFMNESLPRAKGVGTWAHFVPEKQSWLARHRLLAPGSFPDKHLILFLVGPVTGYLTAGVYLILLMDIALVAMKIRKLLRTPVNGSG